MHLPKYSNPHLVVDTTRIVSRRTLQLEDDADADADVERGGEVTGVRLDRREVEDLHMKLDGIVSKRLKLKRALSPSGEAHSSKRHKVLAEEGKPTPQQHPEPVGESAFSCPPQASHQVLSKPSVWYRNHYHLAPFILLQNLPKLYRKAPSPFSRQLTQVIIFSVKEPPCEDTEQELKDRVYRSVLSAVNLEQIEHRFPMVRIPRIFANQILNPHVYVCLSR